MSDASLPLPFVPFDPLDPMLTIPPEVVPDLEELEIEDGKPVDNIFAEKQQRLLTEPVYSSRPLADQPVLMLANVGLFYKSKTLPLAPDVMLSLDVHLGTDLSQRANRSYYVWELGKPPDVVFEFVSDRRGDEASLKKTQYARIRVLYYVIFDPENRLGEGVLRSFELLNGSYQPMKTPYFPLVHLGVTLWEGSYEDQPYRWLRWCDAQGQLVPTGAERAEQERQRADKAEKRAEQADERADKAEKRAEQADERADKAEKVAQQERERIEQLEARLRELGLEP